MIALYTVWYNYARINSAVKCAPAMAAAISTRLGRWPISSRRSTPSRVAETSEDVEEGGSMNIVNRVCWILFVAPGQAITHRQYLFPKRGQLWASRRRYQSRFVHVLYSLIIWAVAISVLMVATAG